MFYDILDTERKNVLPLLGAFKDDFYLAGGTALALHLGHRDSVDLDLFTESHIDTQKLFEVARDVLAGHSLIKVQEEKDTLSIVLDGRIKISFFSYPYPLLKEPVTEEHLRVASIEDIACMKLSAITGRASNKDYIDLYYILQDMPLMTLFGYVKQKLPSLDINLVLKSMVYFDDIEHEQILFKKGREVSFETVQAFLKDEVKRCRV